MPSTSPTIATARWLARHLPAAVAAAAASFAVFASAAAATGCDKVAASYGSDSASGSPGDPLRSAQALADSLAPGQTGCLHAGTYYEDLRVNHGGSAGAALTLQSYPGESARIVGRLYIPRGSDYVTIANLDLDGTNLQGTNQDDLPSPTVDSTAATFQGDDVTNDHTNICFNLGNSGYGRAEQTLIENNRIHDCGVLPAQNHHHGIYVSNADDTRIIGNVIYDNADRGIQLYPDAQRTTIQGNVIDGNGEGVIFSGDGGVASNGNVVENNVISNSNLRNNVESWYPDGNPIGSGNTVRNNCIHGGVRDNGNGGIGDQIGFSVGANVNADPQYVNRAGKDFRLAAGGACAAVLAGEPAPPGGTNPTPVSHPPHGAHRTSGPRVSLKARAGHGRIVVRGSVRFGRKLRSAGAPRVAIEVFRHGRWHVIARVNVVRGRFSFVLRGVRAHRLRLRAVVASVGRSRAITVSL